MLQCNVHCVRTQPGTIYYTVYVLYMCYDDKCLFVLYTGNGGKLAEPTAHFVYKV